MGVKSLADPVNDLLNSCILWRMGEWVCGLQLSARKLQFCCVPTASC